jgi:NADH-quinone oxidoreductase subunit G
MITNEEALMLQTLKEKMGIKLYNPEVRAFQKFLTLYADASGHSLYTSSTKDAMKSDFIVSVGGALRNDSPGLKYSFNNVQKMNKGAGLYFHPVGDTLIDSFGKTVECFAHKVGLEEATLYLVLELFADKDKLSSDVKDYIAELGGAEGLIDLVGGDSKKFMKGFPKMMKKKERFTLMVGEDYYYHDRADNLAKLTALIEMTAGFNVVMNPPKSNALGVAIICDLDDKAEGYTVGYNENGDFRLSALGDAKGDINSLDMPAFNQQEGTVTNLSKRVVPTNVALPYGGYELNDLMKELVSAPEETIDWTKLLPTDRGYKAVEFDSLENYYDNAGNEHIGYLLNLLQEERDLPKVEKFYDDTLLDGDIVYRCNPARQFNDFTAKAHQIFEPFGLYVSSEKAKSLAKKVKVVFEEGSIVVDVIEDKKMKGDIVALSDFKSAENVYGLFNGSRYASVSIKEV